MMWRLQSGLASLPRLTRSDDTLSLANVALPQNLAAAIAGRGFGVRTQGSKRWLPTLAVTVLFVAPWAAMPATPAGWSFIASATAQSRNDPDDDDDVPPEARDSGDVDLETFYRELRPHGTWWDHPRYGRVWTPRGVLQDWKPYTRGHWARTEEHGWYWVAEEEWGWAPFHYGRWGYDEGEGWFWVPGTQWGPAWVVWRENEDIVGWAPLPPDAEWSQANGLQFNSSDYNGTRWAFAWSFVEPQHMFVPGLYNRLIPRQQHGAFLRNTRPIWSYTYRDRRVINGGLDWRRIERRIGSPVPTVRLNFVDSPRRSGWRSIQDPRSVPVYRPRIAVVPGGVRPDRRRDDNPWGWRPQTAPDPRPDPRVERPRGGFWGGRGPETAREPTRVPTRADPPRDVRPGFIPPQDPRVSRPRPANDGGGQQPRGVYTTPDGAVLPGRPPSEPQVRTTPDGAILPGRPIPPPNVRTTPDGAILPGPSPRGGGQAFPPAVVRQPPPPPPAVVRQPPPPPAGAAPPPQTRGDRPRGDAPRGDGPRGDGPRGDGPRGDGPRGDRPRREGERPQ